MHRRKNVYFAREKRQEAKQILKHFIEKFLLQWLLISYLYSFNVAGNPIKIFVVFSKLEIHTPLLFCTFPSILSGQL